jgi:hypothetical protein
MIHPAEPSPSPLGNLEDSVGASQLQNFTVKKRSNSFLKNPKTASFVNVFLFLVEREIGFRY